MSDITEQQYATRDQLRKLGKESQGTRSTEWPVCYIAGPMRGYKDYNFPAFNAAAQRLRVAGWFVYSPAENDLEKGLDSSSELKPLKFYMQTDLAQVCKSDAVFFMDGWEHSEGALLEHNVAQALGIPCYVLRSGGRISILGTDGDGLLLGIDHDLFEEPTDEQLAESYPMETGYRDHGDETDLFTGYPSSQEQIDIAKKQAISERIHALLDDPTAIPPDVQREWNEWNRHPNSARFHQILHEAGDLHDRKQQDYGAADDPFKNVRNSIDFGVDPWIGALIRLNDKIKRLQSLIANGRLANESALDSFRDITVYSIIAQVLFEEQHGRENES